ncbi:MAG: hypothetical protein M1839_006995 [Geoglossum umbratile]|nr:MAG: hypothetical protein M1839_006995 [Geoglossum umbratile]
MVLSAVTVTLTVTSTVTIELSRNSPQLWHDPYKIVLAGEVVVRHRHEFPSTTPVSGSPNVDAIVGVTTSGFGPVLAFVEVVGVPRTKLLRKGEPLLRTTLLVGDPLERCGRESLAEFDAEVSELPAHVKQVVVADEADAETVELPAHVEQVVVFGTPKTAPLAVDTAPLIPGAVRAAEVPEPLHTPHTPGALGFVGIRPNSPTTFGKITPNVAQASQKTS